jgi:signal transduction histidine kinase/ActR/RegA family two-component response regulator
LRNGTPFQIEERIVRADSSIRVLLSQGKWLLDDNRHARKLIGTCHDITARRENERAKMRLQEELQQVQKMESVGRLAGGVAHDFNNLLTVIFGRIGLCEQELPPDSRARKSLSEIQQAAERAATLTRHLLAFSRRQVIYPIILDLNAVVSKLREMLTRVIGEHISLHVTTGESLGSIRADLGQIDQILMNLVINAVDAMPQGGEIFIETANIELDDSYARSHPSVRPGRYVMISVTDTGLGMNQEVLARIFEPFFTTKAIGEGTGLGLSVVHGAVEQNNGHITVHSQPQKGTTFKVYFPRIDETPTPVLPVPESPLPSGSETILLAEDDDAVRALTAELLTSYGYRVLSAQNGAAALEISDRFRERIDLVLTDVVMPAMSGPDLVQTLRSKRPDLNVLYMSGYAGSLLSHHGFLRVEAKFLSKPFTKRELLEQVNVAIKDSSV